MSFMLRKIIPVESTEHSELVTLMIYFVQRSLVSKMEITQKVV